MKDKLFLVLAFSLLALGGYGGYLIFLKITDALKNVDPNVSAALIAGVITIIFSVFIASYNSRKAIERTAFEALVSICVLWKSAAKRKNGKKGKTTILLESNKCKNSFIKSLVSRKRAVYHD